ncbi:MAG TPA: glycosyltransferase family 39 protein [Chitinophagaceae bacterium]|nr:glycosyltransferase family 39 protein [Chitinophagaceae bacterium]
MYKKRLLYLIITCTIIRIIIANCIEFGNDEVYYYTYALHLQQNYFDHPPGVAILIKLFTCNLFFQQQVFIRLGAIVSAAIATWLTYKIGTLVRNQRTGWFAAILYNTSIYTSIIAGTFILPDSPQVVFWLASIWAMLKIVIAFRENGKPAYAQWVTAGVLIGLCIMCKVHGAFLWIGFGLYSLLYQRKIFLQPGFYIAIIITAIIISPIFFWNLQNNFITWRYHSERVEVHRLILNGGGFLQALIGQVFYNNPLNVFILTASLLYLRKHKILSDDVTRLLVLCGLPLILFVTGVSLFRDVLPHWSGPGFLALSFIAAAFLEEKIETRTKSFFRAMLKSSIIFIAVLAVGGMLLIDFYPGTMGNTTTTKYGDGDFTLDMYGWRQFGEQFNAWRQKAETGKEIAPGLPVVCYEWFPAAHIDYYIARPGGYHVIGVGKIDDLHHYAWLNYYRGALNVGDDALCIIPSNYYHDVSAVYGPYFQSVTPLHTFAGTRGGKTTRYFNIFLLKGYKGNDELRGYKVM